MRCLPASPSKNFYELGAAIIFNLNEERIEKLAMQPFSFVADIGLFNEMMDEIGTNAHRRE